MSHMAQLQAPPLWAFLRPAETAFAIDAGGTTSRPPKGWARGGKNIGKRRPRLLAVVLQRALMQVAQQVDAGAWGSFHDRRPSTITLFRVRSKAPSLVVVPSTSPLAEVLAEDAVLFNQACDQQ